MEIPATFLSFQPLLVLLILLHFSSSLITSDLGSSLPGCPNKCGNVNISYPFGFGDACFFPGFEVTCTQGIPFLAGNLQLFDTLPGEVRVSSKPFSVATCRPLNESGKTYKIQLLQESPYTFSITKNIFTVVGCGVGGVIHDGDSTMSICTTVCHRRESMDNGSCTGEGCCQATLPRVQKAFFIGTLEAGVTLNLVNFSLCSNWFLVEDGTYSFTESDIMNLNLTTDVATILEWAIGEGNCKDARKKNTSICGENSRCYESKRHVGYLCKCFPSHEGNPYLNGPQGCQVIDYCNVSNDCVSDATCQNINGGYHCICPKWSEGDGYRGGKGCHYILQVIQILLGTILSIPFMITALFWFYCARKNRHLAKMRANYFRRNGGLLLQQHFSSGKGTTTKHIKIFSARELETATNNYDISRVLGWGSQGTVYKGILDGGSTIAIKRSQLVAQCQVDQFINELVILSQINHRNIVKLIGCCLETQVPLLVYEFIPGGTLYQKLHGDSESSTRLLWNDRLRIAIEIGEALSYLHSYACMPIFHRDIKSSNILLDENNTAKLADFGVSRLVPLDNKRVSTAVHGTIGYLDPEYFNTGKLTEKSDVYSFGVVLLELLTGRRPVQHEETRDYSSLVMHFQSYVGKENLFEILDEEIVKEGNFEEMRVVAGVASRCLTVFGSERPTMRKVVQKLVSMRRETP